MPVKIALTAALELLKRYEWIDDGESGLVCLECWAEYRDGGRHEHDCELAAAIGSPLKTWELNRGAVSWKHPVKPQ